MKKLFWTTAALLALAGCSKHDEGTATTASSASAAGPASVTPTAETKVPSMVDKALSFLSGGPFEGDITMTVTDDARGAAEGPQTIVYTVKGTKMRFDVPHHHGGPEGNSWAIFDSSSKKMTTVTDSKKMAMVMDLGDAPKLSRAAEKKPTVTDTGKSDTVAGYRCEVWSIKQDNGDGGEACVANGIAFPSVGAQSSWISSMGQNGFPLRVSMKDASGKEKMKMEVTKIEKKSVDDKTFEVPAGYHTMDMASMMKSLGMSGLHPPH